MRKVLSISVVILIVMMSSCAGKGQVRPPAPVYNGPVSIDALKERIAFSNIPGMRTEVKATLFMADEKEGSFSGALAMRPPDDMRIVLYNPFGSVIIDMVLSGGRIEAYSPGDDTLYVDSAPSLMPPVDAEFMLEVTERAYFLRAFVEGKMVREYVFDSRSALNIQTTSFNGGGSPLVAKFSGHWGTLPSSMALIYGNGLRLEVAFDGAEIDPEIPDRLFPLGRSASRVLAVEELETSN